MLQFPAQQQSKQVDERPDIELVEQAQGLFRRVRLRGKMGVAWSRLSGRSNRLLDLSQVAASERITGRHYAGIRTVPLSQIRGSEGRSNDFDLNFNPLQDRLNKRWLNIALVWLSGGTLPPVKLIQVGDTYFVQDGHHRISVAQALGQTDIDAEVTVWEIHKSSRGKEAIPTCRPVGQPV